MSDPNTSQPVGIDPDLHELSLELAAAEKSEWQPKCIARAFTEPGPGELVLTMGQWIALDKVCSPFLLGEIPSTVEELEKSAAVFGLTTASLKEEEVVTLAGMILEAVVNAFATAIEMRPPKRGDDNPHELPSRDGFGSWLPLYACLVTQCGLSDSAALAYRVDRAHALLAGYRRNQSWEPLGPTYRERDVIRRPEAEAAGEEQPKQSTEEPEGN